MHLADMFPTLKQVSSPEIDHSLNYILHHRILAPAMAFDMIQA